MSHKATTLYEIQGIIFDNRGVAVCDEIIGRYLRCFRYSDGRNRALDFRGILGLSAGIFVGIYCL